MNERERKNRPDKRFLDVTDEGLDGLVSFLDELEVPSLFYNMAYDLTLLFYSLLSVYYHGEGI
jgi:hypothetical protein